MACITFEFLTVKCSLVQQPFACVNLSYLIVFTRLIGFSSSKRKGVGKIKEANFTTEPIEMKKMQADPVEILLGFHQVG